MVYNILYYIFYHGGVVVYLRVIYEYDSILVFLIDVVLLINI
jgi:hypothetical protein